MPSIPELKVMSQFVLLIIGCILPAISKAQQTVSTFDIEDDAPPPWIDGIFFFWIFAIHVYYAYKFTDYSLDHIHRQLTEIEKADVAIDASKSTMHHMTSHDSMPFSPNSLNTATNNNSSTHNVNVAATRSGSDVLSIQAMNTESVTHNASLHMGHAGYAFVKTRSSEIQTSGSINNNSGVNIMSPPSKTGSTNNITNNDNVGNTSSDAVGAISAKASTIEVPTTGDEAANELGLGSTDDFPVKSDAAESGIARPKSQESHISVNNDSDNESEASNQVRREQMLMELEDAKSSMQIKVDYVTLARPLTGYPNTRCCCLFPWSHVLFSWSRTNAVRFFLRLYILLACSLALVLWIEFFGNTILEFAITCVLLRRRGFWLGLFLLPFLIFVLETCLRYSWQALLIGWNMGSDNNGDIEALDNKRLKKAIRKLKSETKKLLRRQAKLYSRLHRESMQIIKSESLLRINSHESTGGRNSKENSTNNSSENVATGGDIELGGMKSANSENELMGDDDSNFAGLFEFDASEVEKQLQKAIRKHQAVIVGDFFVGTCWRLQVATATLGMAVASAYLKDVTLFYQYLMRYMAAAGLMWCVVYFFFAIFISYFARLSSWKQAHPEIPLWVFFVLSDATDYDLGFEKDLWVILKIIVAVGSVVGGIVSMCLGAAFSGHENNGYFYFTGGTLLLYYCANVLQTCKPQGVMALWRDDIPNPSTVFIEEQKRISYALHLWEQSRIDDLALVYHGPSEQSEDEQQQGARSPIKPSDDVDANTRANSGGLVTVNEEVWTPTKGKKSNEMDDKTPTIDTETENNMHYLPNAGSASSDEEAETAATTENKENTDNNTEKTEDKTNEEDKKNVAALAAAAVPMMGDAVSASLSKSASQSDNKHVRNVKSAVQLTVPKGADGASTEPKGTSLARKAQSHELSTSTGGTQKLKLAPTNSGGAIGARKGLQKHMKTQRSYRGLQEFWKKQEAGESDSEDETAKKKEQKEKDAAKLNEKEEQFFDHVFKDVMGDEFDQSSSEEEVNVKDRYEIEREKLIRARRERLERRRRKEAKKQAKLNKTGQSGQTDALGLEKYDSKNRDKEQLDNALEVVSPVSDGGDNEKKTVPAAAGTGTDEDGGLKYTGYDSNNDGNASDMGGISSGGGSPVDASGAAAGGVGTEKEETDLVVASGSTILPMGLITDVVGAQARMDENEEEEHNMVNGITGRVYSEYGRYTYRLIEGFEFGLVTKADEKYVSYLGSDNKRLYYYGRMVMRKDKFKNVFHNYVNYWLDVYRPYDEYDVDRNLSRSGFMYGFQCCKTWTRIRPALLKKQRRKRRKAHKELSYGERALKFGSRCLGWSLDHLCNIILAIAAFAVLLSLYYFSTTLDIEGTGEGESVFPDLADFNSSNITEVTLDTSDDTNGTNIIQHYGMCDTLWQDAEHFTTLSVLDVLTLTQFVYEQDDYDLLQMVDAYFDGEYEVVARRDIEPVFFHMRHKEYKVDYIAVRGTSTPEEALQDISLFIEVTGFQLLSWVFPFLNALPTGFVRTIVSYASFAEGLINAEARSAFGDTVEEYALEYLGKVGYDTNMYVVGHSLGGAVAQIVAAKLYENGDFSTSYFASMGLNSPGTLYSSAKFGFEPSSLQLTSTSLLAERDLVSAVDEHSGNIQEVQCPEKSLVACHLSRVPICELWENCQRDTARYYTVFEQYCDTESDHEHRFGSILGAQNVSVSNFTIIRDLGGELAQILINVTADN